MSEPTTSKKGGKGKGKGKGASVPGDSEQTTTPIEKPQSAPTHNADHTEAVICESKISGPYIGGSYTGHSDKKRTFDLPNDLSSDVRVQVSSVKRVDATAYDGFTLEFVIGSSNESNGFGIRYEPVMENADLARISVAKTYKILVSTCIVPSILPCPPSIHSSQGSTNIRFACHHQS